MLDINRHKFFLVQILKDIYSDIELGGTLGFKGGTALMFFYDLPRFSVDLDFNLIAIERQDVVFEKVRSILLKYGKITDEAKKFYGPVLVLEYGAGERKLKVEISNRMFANRDIFDRGLLQGLGELMDPSLKTFVKTKLRTDTISLFRFYKEFPVTS